MKLLCMLIAGVVFFSSCTGESKVGETTTSATSTIPGTFIARTADVPPDSSYEFTYSGERAILVNINGNYLAYVNKCTHAGCPFALSGGILKCPCHGSQFDPLTGEVLGGPAQRSITSIDVSVLDGSIYAKNV